MSNNTIGLGYEYINGELEIVCNTPADFEYKQLKRSKKRNSTDVRFENGDERFFINMKQALGEEVLWVMNWHIRAKKRGHKTDSRGRFYKNFTYKIKNNVLEIFGTKDLMMRSVAEEPEVKSFITEHGFMQIYQK